MCMIEITNRVKSTETSPFPKHLDFSTNQKGEEKQLDK